MKGQNSDSWFSKLDEISEKYSLNSPHDLIVNPPTKSSWNRSVGTTINEYYINQMVKDAIVTANGSVPQLDQILWKCPYLASVKCRNFSELLFSASFTI
jgi:hypothetical protein